MTSGRSRFTDEAETDRDAMIESRFFLPGILNGSVYSAVIKQSYCVLQFLNPTPKKSVLFKTFAFECVWSVNLLLLF